MGLYPPKREYKGIEDALVAAASLKEISHMPIIGQVRYNCYNLIDYGIKTSLKKLKTQTKTPLKKLKINKKLP